MYAKLNLPEPSHELLEMIKKDAFIAPINPDNKRWLDEFHNGTINSALHLFYDAGEYINNRLREEFQQFFPNHKLRMIIGIMQGTVDQPTCHPPHIDRARALAVNYYIELGGEEVTTVFYNLVQPIRGESYNIRYDQTNGCYSQTIFNKGWYAYDVTRCHSVENLQGTRLFFAIRLISDSTQDTDHYYSLKDLLQEYPKLIKNIITQ